MAENVVKVNKIANSILVRSELQSYYMETPAVEVGKPATFDFDDTGYGYGYGANASTGADLDLFTFPSYYYQYYSDGNLTKMDKLRLYEYQGGVEYQIEQVGCGGDPLIPIDCAPHRPCGAGHRQMH